MIRKDLSLFPFLFIFIILLATFSFSQQRGSLEKIVISKTEKTLEVRVLLSLFSYYRQFELSGPNRVVIDCFDTRSIKTPSFLRVNALGVRGIRTGMFKPGTARVVFDMIDQIPPYKIESIENGLRILFWPEEEKVIEEKVEIEIEDAICDIKVNPVKANVNDPIFVDMSGSKNAKSMEVEVFDKEGMKITSQKLTPENPKWETRFDKPGEYFFKGKAFSTEDKSSENLCEARTYINSPPVSRLECSPCKERILKPITLDATGSTDPDGQIIRVDFDITDEEGNLVDRFTDNEMPFSWEKVFEDKGLYTVTAIGTDDYGAMSEPAQVNVVVRGGQKETFHPARFRCSGCPRTRYNICLVYGRTTGHSLSDLSRHIRYHYLRRRSLYY
ncbi:MAG TPA: AMIN domain-containing protein [Candidatus Aminicenantes bacterium]|nr:AMIN domain-containing protein [Candidatus Aminicenantes bacterium]